MELRLGRPARILLVALAGSTVFLLSCKPPERRQDPTETSATPTPSSRRVVIAEGSQPVAGAVYVAYEKRLWTELGLQVELVPFASGRLCLDAVLAGKADVGTMAETPIMHAGFQGQPIFVIAGIHQSQRNTKVVARKDKGVLGPRDLRGRRVAVSLGTNGEFFMDEYLRKAGLTRTAVEAVNLRPEDMVAALVRGDVDACFTWEPHIQNAKQQLGDKAIVLLGGDVYTETYNLVVTQRFAKERPDDVLLVLKGLDRAIDYMHTHREEAISIVATRIGLDPGVMTAIWDNYTFRLSLEPLLLNSLVAQAKWSMAQGIAPRQAPIPDYRRMLLIEPLKAVKPEAVSVP